MTVMNNQLPEPVKKYLGLVLPEKYSVIKKVWLSHDGFFRSSPKSDWVKIKGEQSFNTAYPEFIWEGKTKLLKATDRYVNGKGRLKVKLLGLIPIVNAAGPELDQAELLRWLGESVWFPTNLLPGQGLNWDPVDMDHARLSYHFGGFDLSYLVTFNKAGEISRIETLRWKEKGELEKWVGKTSDYKDFNGFKIPTRIEASWFNEDVEFQYVDFHVKTISYTY